MQVRVRGGIKARLRSAKHWPIDRKMAFLIFTRKDSFYLDPYVPLPQLQLFLLRRFGKAMPLMRYVPRFDTWTGRIIWNFRGLQPVYDLSRCGFHDRSPLRLDPDIDRVAGQVAAAVGRYIEFMGIEQVPVHYAPPLDKIYFAYRPEQPPVMEPSLALRNAARRFFRKSSADSPTHEELIKAWQISEIEIDGLRAWPQEFFVRPPGYRYTECRGELAPAVFNDVYEGDCVGNWKFLDGRWTPACQRPIRVYVRTEHLAGFPHHNPAYEILEEANLLPDLDAELEDPEPLEWLQNVGEEMIDALGTRLTEMPRADVEALIEQVRQRAVPSVRWQEDDLGNALMDPRQPLRAFNVPLPVMLSIRGGFSAETTTWETPGVTFQLAEMPQHVAQLLADRKSAPSKPRGRQKACVGQRY